MFNALAKIWLVGEEGERSETKDHDVKEVFNGCDRL